jgi:hypothetical protein
MSSEYFASVLYREIRFLSIPDRTLYALSGESLM